MKIVLEFLYNLLIFPYMKSIIDLQLVSRSISVYPKERAQSDTCRRPHASFSLAIEALECDAHTAMNLLVWFHSTKPIPRDSFIDSISTLSFRCMGWGLPVWRAWTIRLGGCSEDCLMYCGISWMRFCMSLVMIKGERRLVLLKVVDYRSFQMFREMDGIWLSIGRGAWV